MLGKLFGKKKGRDLKEDEVRVVLPEESYTLIEYKEDDLPCVATVNSGLLDFESKDRLREQGGISLASIGYYRL